MSNKRIKSAHLLVNENQFGPTLFDHIVNMPNEVILHILSYCSVVTILNIQYSHRLTHDHIKAAFKQLEHFDVSSLFNSEIKCYPRRGRREKKLRDVQTIMLRCSHKLRTVRINRNEAWEIFCGKMRIHDGQPFVKMFAKKCPNIVKFDYDDESRSSEKGPEYHYFKALGSNPCRFCDLQLVLMFGEVQPSMKEVLEQFNEITTLAVIASYSMSWVASVLELKSRQVRDKITQLEFIMIDTSENTNSPHQFMKGATVHRIIQACPQLKVVRCIGGPGCSNGGYKNGRQFINNVQTYLPQHVQLKTEKWPFNGHDLCFKTSRNRYRIAN
ncbi:hypothetical protein HDE_05918 [Halotydeus destructor]|nr:hypothetical protein HDE_05918 [Halotydeus destructor]